MQSEVPKWDQALGQNREGLPARTAYPSSHPYSFLLVVVSLAEAPSVANDRIVAANGASPRQALQRNYPGSGLSFVSGSAITRITAGVKARRRPSPAKFRSAGRAFTLPVKSVSDEKRILLSGDDGDALTFGHWPLNFGHSYEGHNVGAKWASRNGGDGALYAWDWTYSFQSLPQK